MLTHLSSGGHRSRRKRQPSQSSETIYLHAASLTNVSQLGKPDPQDAVSQQSTRSIKGRQKSIGDLSGKAQADKGDQKKHKPKRPEAELIEVKKRSEALPSSPSSLSSASTTTMMLGLHDLARPLDHGKQKHSSFAAAAGGRRVPHVNGRQPTTRHAAQKGAAAKASSQKVEKKTMADTAPRASDASEQDDIFAKQLLKVAAMDLAHLRAELSQYHQHASGSKPVLRQRLKHYYETHLKHSLHDGHQPATQKHHDLSYLLIAEFGTASDEPITTAFDEEHLADYAILSISISLYSIDSQSIEDTFHLDVASQSWANATQALESWLETNCLSLAPDPHSDESWAQWCWAVQGSQLMTDGMDHLLKQAETEATRPTYFQWWIDIGDQFARFYKSPHASVKTMLQNLGHGEEDTEDALALIVTDLVRDGWRPEVTKVVQWTPSTQ